MTTTVKPNLCNLACMILTTNTSYNLQPTVMKVLHMEAREMFAPVQPAGLPVLLHEQSHWHVQSSNSN